LRDAWIEGARRLAAAGIDSARLDARVLLAQVVGVAPEDLFGVRDPSASQLERFDASIARREAREPLAYITGHKEFWGLPFDVGTGVLIPRPETETLIEQAIREFPDNARPLKVLDLGTGSGCLLISFLASFLAGRGTGVDNSADALRWARRNAEQNGVGSRCEWREGDWNAVENAASDVIFSNPPYLALRDAAGLAVEIARFEPPGALFAGPDGLDAYRDLAPVVASGLSPGGKAFLEIGYGQSEAVCEILAERGLEIVRVAADLSGVPRCVVARPRF